MSPTDVRFVAFFSLAVGSLMGYFLLHQKKTDVTSQAPDVMHNQDESNVVGQIQAEKSIRLVVQRFRKASLLIEESRTVTVGDDAAEGYSGILVYASFAKSATEESVIQAAKTIMNLPLLTRGVWGDGSDPVSVLDMATQGSAGVAVMLVPQANLISKVSDSNDTLLPIVTIDVVNTNGTLRHQTGAKSRAIHPVSWSDWKGCWTGALRISR